MGWRRAWCTAALLLVALGPLAGGCWYEVGELSPAGGSGGAGSSQGGGGAAGGMMTAAGGMGGTGAGGIGGSAGAGGGRAPSVYALAVMRDGPVAYWRLGEGSGMVVQDEVGMSLGSYQGGVTLGEPGAVGDGDSAARLDGSNGMILVGDIFDFAGLLPFSIELWVKPHALNAGYPRLFSKEGFPGGERNGYTAFIRNGAGNQVGFERWVGNDIQPGVYGTDTLATEQFSHVVVTFDGTSSRLYVNGNPLGMSITTVGSLPDVNEPLVFGATPQNGDHLNATLDELAVYDKALSPDRIDAHYQAAKP